MLRRIRQAVDISTGTSFALSHPPSPKIAWSLQTHARTCRSSDSRALCDIDYILSQDVQVHVLKHDKQLYSAHPDSEGRRVRAEIPHGYSCTKAMLGKKRKKSTKRAPIASCDLQTCLLWKNDRDKNVLVEPVPAARTAWTPEDDRRPERYELVNGEQGELVCLPKSVKRGGLLESDMRRPRQGHITEARRSPRERGELRTSRQDVEGTRR